MNKYVEKNAPVGKKTRNKLFLCRFFPPAPTWNHFSSPVRLTPAHYIAKPRLSPTTLHRSPWGGFLYPASPPHCTPPISPLFNSIPPGMDTRGLEGGWEEMCLFVLHRECVCAPFWVGVWGHGGFCSGWLQSHDGPLIYGSLSCLQGGNEERNRLGQEKRPNMPSHVSPLVLWVLTFMSFFNNTRKSIRCWSDLCIGSPFILYSLFQGPFQLWLNMSLGFHQWSESEPPRHSMFQRVYVLDF